MKSELGDVRTYELLGILELDIGGVSTTDVKPPGDGEGYRACILPGHSDNNYTAKRRGLSCRHCERWCDIGHEEGGEGVR